MTRTYDYCCPVCGGPVGREPMAIDEGRRIVRLGTKVAALTPVELSLLTSLNAKYPHAVYNERLIFSAWYEDNYDPTNEGPEDATKALKDTMNRLRSKLRLLDTGIDIQSVWGGAWVLRVNVLPHGADPLPERGAPPAERASPGSLSAHSRTPDARGLAPHSIQEGYSNPAGDQPDGREQGDPARCAAPAEGQDASASGAAREPKTKEPAE